MRLVWKLWLRFSSRSCLLYLPVLTFLLFTVKYKLLTDEYITYATHQDTHPSKQKDVNNNIRASGDLTLDDLTLDDLTLDDLTLDDLTLDLRQDWVEVPGSKLSVFLYSAYLDRRGDENVVRIITAIRKNFKVESCLLLMEEGKKEVRVSARTMLIRENYGLSYSAAFVVCDLPPSEDPSSFTPMAVSLTEKSTSDNR
ncbi:hypothetical protein Pmani_001451 [Petrolisthes manimaculis]|uniref:Uncharacterized protein n=1 Tax=Petrolisthes manimaculis TaxID=1843537 RepID=A0AAE1URJ6_9EUCA|nr:hypothetical protein Pmani_001451 [Petrolisthes manimaculis]